MLPRARDYAELRARFRWRIPARYNIALDCLERHARERPDAPALIHEQGAGQIRTYRFAELQEQACRAANALAALGVGQGDRVGILLGQAPETALAHMACYRLGAIAIPLFTLFGPEALYHRLADSGARLVVTDAEGSARLETIRAELPALEQAVVTGLEGPADQRWERLLEWASPVHRAVDTAADAPALIIYTSGTTGNPKGALHAHRVLLGHLPGVELPQDFFPQPGDCFWTPADWAWIGGLLDVLLPAWHHGVPVVAHRAGRFDPEAALALMARHQVRNAFLPPTALRLMRQVERPERFGARLRSVGSGGEPLGGDLQDWARRALNAPLNEFYGQTECNLVVASCAGFMDLPEGAMGRAVPGHRLAVLGEDGEPVSPGRAGQIAVARPDPVMFLGYWNNPEATREKFCGDWLLTGDQGIQDDTGAFHFVGRDDDVITSAGYRIGPAEVESCLQRHPAVARAAVVGRPDALRTQVVKAFLVLADGARACDALTREIQRFVRERLAAHEYPREIEFIDELPLTATGKVMRRVLREKDGEKPDST